MEHVHIGLLILAACMGAGALSDVISRRIPNWLCVFTALAGLGIGALDGLGVHLLWQSASMVAALIVGIAIYALKFWGGGDAKFFAGAAAWFPLTDLLNLVLAISIAGLILTVIWIGWRMRASKRGGAKQKSEIPYGVAIAFGGLGTAIWL